MTKLKDLCMYLSLVIVWMDSAIDHHVACCESVVGDLVLTVRYLEDSLHLAPGSLLFSSSDSANDVTFRKLRDSDITFDSFLHTHFTGDTVYIDININTKTTTRFILFNLDSRVHRVDVLQVGWTERLLRGR